MSDSNETILDDELQSFLSGRNIYTVQLGDSSDWSTWKQHEIMISPEETGHFYEEFSNEIKSGDVVIAVEENGGSNLTYGIGVVSESDCGNGKSTGLDWIDDTDQLKFEYVRNVNWVEIAGNGEIITEGGPSEFPSEPIASVDIDFFVDLIDGVDNEDYPPSGRYLIDSIYDSAALNDLESLLDSHLPEDWDTPTSQCQYIVKVVGQFLTNTDKAESTSERRRAAIDRARFELVTDADEIERSCGSQLWKRARESSTDDGIEEYFDPALERIEEAWSAGVPWETAHSAYQDVNLFLMPVNDRWFPEFQRTVDNPVVIDDQSAPDVFSEIEKARVWGTREGERNAETFESLSEGDVILYYRNEAIIAAGRVDEKFEGSEIGAYMWDNSGSKFVYTLNQYTPLGMPRETLWDLLDYDDNFAPQGFSRVYPDRVEEIRPESGDLWEIFQPYVVPELPDGSEDIPIQKPGPSLDQWVQETLEGDYEYFILKTGDDEYDDEPSESYHFRENIPGSKQLPEAGDKARFVYLEGEEFYAVGSINSIKSEDKDGTEHFYAQIDDYHEIDKVSRGEVESGLSVNFPIQYGIIKIEEEDYEHILSGQFFRDIEHQLEQLLNEESSQAWIYREAMAHLVAGKNLVFYGPPGTGKTRAARKLADIVCGGNYSLVTANAEWSNYQVVGGYAPSGEGFEPQPGFLTSAAIECQNSLQRQSGTHPSWLLIDELNRANLDEAFGDVFTLLDIDYRTTRGISYASSAETIQIPLSFRILATMNTYDQAQLFSLGYAFRRRFAFVRVPSLMDDRDNAPESQRPKTRIDDAQLSAGSRTTIEVIKGTIAESLLLGTEKQEGVTLNDVALIVEKYAKIGRVTTAIEELNESEELDTGDLDWLETMVYFAQEIMEREVIEIGQALLIDAAKFVVTHQLLFKDKTHRSVLDQAVVSYIVPQFEHFMPKLRRAETIDQDSTAKNDFEEIIDLAKQLGLPKTASVLSKAKDEKRVLE